MRKLSLVALAIIAFQIIPVVAAPLVERTQTVYTIADWTGKPTETSVVNWIRVEGEGKVSIKDTPDLENVTVLDSKTQPKQDGSNLTWDADGTQDIFYTGKTKKELPVSIKVDLKLDGKPVTPEQVKGNGSLEVGLSFTNHLSSQETLSWETGSGKVSETKTVYYPMTIMVQLSIDIGDYDEIKGDSAMPMTVGGTSRYIWTAFPKPDAKVNFTIRSKSLKLPPLQISIMPIAPSIELPSIDQSTIDILGSFGGNADLFNMLDIKFDFDSKEASKNIDQLTQLLDGVKTAVDTANSGLGGLSKLLANYATNLKTMEDGVDGLKQLSDGHKQVIDTMKSQFDANAGGIDATVDSLKTTSDTASKVSRQLFTIKTNLEDMTDLIKQIKSQITDAALISKLDELEKLRKSAYDKIDPVKTDADKVSSNLKTMIDGGTIGGKTVPSISSLPEQMQLLGDTLTALSEGGTIMGQKLPGISTTVDGLKNISDGLKLIVDGGKFQGQTVPPFADIPKQLGSAVDGLKLLVAGGKFNGMTVPPQSEMKKMISDFKHQLDTMPDTKKLSQTMDSLKSTVEKAGGSEKVKQAIDDTQKLLFESQAEYDRMKELGTKYASFVGNTDNSKGSVIFVIKFAEKPSDVTFSDQNKGYNAEKSIMDNDIGKYKYILLIAALLIIILAFPINWLYKKRISNKK